MPIILFFVFVFYSGEVGAYTLFYDSTGIQPTFEEHEADVAALCAANTAWKCGVVGTTFGGRSVRYIEISHSNDTQSIVIDACVHGVEKQGIIIIMDLLRYIAANNAFPTTKIIVVPNLNPDGYVANSQKNGREVNINRNASVGWAVGAYPAAPPGYTSSGSLAPSEELYVGPTPASEIESQANMYVLRKYKPNKYINVHAGGNGLNRYNSAETTSVFNEIDAYVTGQGFQTLVSGATNLLYTGKIRDFAHAHGATSYAYESAQYGDATVEQNQEESNRFIAAMIALVGATVTTAWVPDKQLVTN